MKRVKVAALLAALILGIGSLMVGATTANAATAPDIPRAVRGLPTSAQETRDAAVLRSLRQPRVQDQWQHRNLYGQVVRASTKSEAAHSVARIPGVTDVVNNIEVLPLSSFDNSIRVRTLRALQRSGSLYRYFLGADPSLHIVVNRGHVTLTGVVGSNLDRQLAYMTARQISGVFSVTNDLRLDGEGGLN